MTGMLERVLAHGAGPGADRPALTAPGGAALTHRGLSDAVSATVNGLRRNGFEPGDRLLFSVRLGALLSQAW